MADLLSFLRQPKTLVRRMVLAEVLGTPRSRRQQAAGSGQLAARPAEPRKREPGTGSGEGR